MIVCVCRGISLEDIRAFAAGRRVSVEEVVNFTNASKDCGLCLRMVERVVAKIVDEGP